MNKHLPYYFDIPELDDFPIKPNQYDYDSFRDKNFYMPLDPYYGTRGLGLSFTWTGIDPVIRKQVEEFARDRLQVKVGVIFLLKTLENCAGFWHVEGPSNGFRQCAINFPIAGNFENSLLQWGEVEKYKHLPVKDFEYQPVPKQHDKVTVVAETKTNKCIAASTILWHRAENYNPEKRIVLSLGIEANTNLESLYKLYTEGRLIR